MGKNNPAVDAVADQIRALKTKLKEEGLSGKKINDHPEIKELVQKLQTLREGGAPAPAPATTPAPETAGGDIQAQIDAVGAEIRTLKEKLKAEGLSGNKINKHPQVAELVS